MTDTSTPIEPSSPKKRTPKKVSMATVISDMGVVADFPFSLSDLLPIKDKLVSYFEAAQTTSDMTSNSSDIASEFSSVWGIFKGSPYFSTMTIGLICSFVVSATFYWAGKLLMKIKFEEMFSEKLPRAQQLVYSIGGIQNIDIDRVLLRDDLNENYFSANAKDGSIVLDMEQLLATHQIMQSLTAQRIVNPENLLSKGDLDESVFEVQENTGHISIDLKNVIERHQLVQSTGAINHLNVDDVLMRDDLPPHIMGASAGKVEDLSILDEQFADGVLIVDGAANKQYARLLKRKVAICPRKPIVLEIYDDCDLKVLGALIKNLSDKVVLDLAHYSQDTSVFDQFAVTVLQNANG